MTAGIVQDCGKTFQSHLLHYKDYWLQFGLFKKEVLLNK